MTLQAKIAAKRAQLEAERRRDMLEHGAYFNESAGWWFEQALSGLGVPRSDSAACRKAAIASATTSHLCALRILALENTP